MSSISAANQQLHELLLAEVDAGIERLQRLAA